MIRVVCPDCDRTIRWHEGERECPVCAARREAAAEYARLASEVVRLSAENRRLRAELRAGISVTDRAG